MKSPVYTLLDSPETPNLEAKSYLANDPALVIFYTQLREKTVQTLRGASKIPPRAEWEFVIQNARLYDRMGCDLLALDLGQTFIFFHAYFPPNPYNLSTLDHTSQYLTNSRIKNSPQLGIPTPRPRAAATTTTITTTTKPP